MHAKYVRVAVWLIVGILLVGVLVACSDDTPACAANAPRPAQPRSNSGGYRSRPSSGSRTSGSNSWKPSSTKTRVVVIPQPVPVYRHDGWRMYPGYGGWWAPGFYPPGYVDHYHCHTG